MQRHGRGGGVSSLRPRARTPYERPPPGMGRRRRSSAANEDHEFPDEPEHDAAAAAQTPGLLSRVRSMLSPAKLWSPGRRSKLSGAGPAPAAEERAQDPDRMNDGEPVQQPVTPFKFPAPGESQTRRPSSLSRDSIVDSARRDSPNEKLRQFFMAKGDDKLTEMEVEGVMSLIRQAKEQNESAIDIDVVSGGASSAAAASGPSTPSQPLRNRKSLPQFSTPVAVQARSPATYTPRYGSSASSSAASSAARKETEASKAATPNIRYMDIPTPYRPARRSSPLRQSSKSDSVQSESGSQAEFSLAQSASETVDTPPEPQPAPKPMSQTASVLLSLLDEGDDKNPEEPPKPETKPFVSPYAASPRRATPVRRRESAESPKKSPLQQLEHARPKQATAAAGPATASVTSNEAAAKYKPARSSSLRQSIVIDADSPPAKPLPTSTAPSNATPSNLFKLSPASTALFQPPPQQSQADSQSQDLSPSKPLFHSRAEPNNKPVPRAHAPAQPPSLFSVKPAETTATAPPPVASSSVFSSDPVSQPAAAGPPANFSFTKAEPSPSVDSTTSTDTHKDLPAFGFPDVAHVAAPTLSAADIATLERLKSSSFTF